MTGSAKPPADLAGVPLDQIRRRIERARTARTRRRLAAALDRDPRHGARRLAWVLRRRVEADRTERARLFKLFARRNRLLRAGARFVAGVDEVGVGPLAGPVVAAAVVLPRKLDLDALHGLDDSKRLTARSRETLAQAIRELCVGVSVAEVSPADVDRLNIYHAALEAMRRAVVGLAVDADRLLVDARTIPNVRGVQTPIPGGDASDGSIAAASIVAKVHRDALMLRLHERHPDYGFDRHMGYATREHLEALTRLGPIPDHRRSFAPVARAHAQALAR